MAFAAVGALIAGEAVTTAVVLSAVAEIGSVIGVVGAVTGNKEMMKIGGTMALVGGVGSMAMGASGAAGAGAAAEGSLATEGTGALLKGVDAAAGDAFSGASLGGDAAITAQDMAGAQLNPELDPSLNPPVSDSSMPVGDAATPATSTASQADGSMPVGPETSGTPQATPVTDNTTVKDNTLVEGATGPADVSSPTAGQSSGNFFKSMSDFANKNKTLFNAGMQVVGGAMNGANQRDIANQKFELEQQKLNQTSYGSQVATAPRGILAGAR